MKHLFTLLAVAAVAGFGMSSCSSSRSAQTTDDIYYSSGSSRSAAAAGDEKDEYYSTAPSDNYVRMKAQDQARWSYFDDYAAYDSYYASPMGYGWGYPAYSGFGYGLGYGFGLGLGFGYGAGFWNPYSAWNNYYMWNSWYNPYFYNPYYGGAVFVVGHTASPGAVYSNLRPFNALGYRNGLASNTRPTNNTRFYRPGMATTSNYNSSLNGQGRQMRQTNGSFYSPNARPGSNNGAYRPAFNNQPARSYSPTPSFGGSRPSGGFSGGGGGFSRPGRH
jgi:hypothetical protein